MELEMASRILLAVGCTAVLASFSFALAERLEDTTYVPYEHKAIQYFETPTNEAVKHLDDLLDEGKAKLDYAGGGLGYLPSLLKKLGFERRFAGSGLHANQFSGAADLAAAAARGLFQRRYRGRICAAWRSDGGVRARSDAGRGVLHTRALIKKDKPAFARREVCLQCHQGGQTLGVPGLVVSSAYMPKGVEAEHKRGGFVTDDRTAIEDRWGGWYRERRSRGAEAPGYSDRPWHRAEVRHVGVSESRQRRGGAADAGTSDTHDEPDHPCRDGIRGLRRRRESWRSRRRSWMRRSRTWWVTCCSWMKRR